MKVDVVITMQISSKCKRERERERERERCIHPIYGAEPIAWVL
jgi:hypothetical protein